MPSLAVIHRKPKLGEFWYFNYAFISGTAKKNVTFKSVIHRKPKLGEILNFNYLPISHMKLDFNEAG